MLTTRALLILRVPRLLRLDTGCLDWFMPLPHIIPDNATWYLDGSMVNREVFELRSVGFGIVIVSNLDR